MFIPPPLGDAATCCTERMEENTWASSTFVSYSSACYLKNSGHANIRFLAPFPVGRPQQPGGRAALEEMVRALHGTTKSSGTQVSCASHPTEQLPEKNVFFFFFYVLNLLHRSCARRKKNPRQTKFSETLNFAQKPNVESARTLLQLELVIQHRVFITKKLLPPCRSSHRTFND